VLLAHFPVQKSQIPALCQRSRTRILLLLFQQLSAMTGAKQLGTRRLSAGNLGFVIAEFSGKCTATRDDSKAEK
jgi:hypothetical protein